MRGLLVLSCAGFVIAFSSAGCATQRKGVIENLPSATPSVSRRATVPAIITPELPSLPKQPSLSYIDVRSVVPSRRLSNRWKHIVIHHSASDSGSAQSFDSYHRNVNRWEELGYHFVIGNGNGSADGKIEIGSRWVKQKHGAHCKTPDNYYNEHGIGICMVGNFQNSAPTHAQMASLTRLVQALLQECGISPLNVVTHSGVTGRTACPGAKFPLHRLKQAVVAAGPSPLNGARSLAGPNRSR